MPPPPDAPPPSSEEYSNEYDRRHYAWCARRYRSYSAYDNSFQPSRGPHRQCYSPYN
ncbi:BA14K family protein [Rhizobium changzhiense]|uniref:BA14K family protein n=1 Tax=Rhizobium changzhiense TaxID=2692317 RepID=UPI003B8A90A0